MNNKDNILKMIEDTRIKINKSTSNNDIKRFIYDLKFVLTDDPKNTSITTDGKTIYCDIEFAKNSLTSNDINDKIFHSWFLVNNDLAKKINLKIVGNLTNNLTNPNSLSIAKMLESNFQILNGKKFKSANGLTITNGFSNVTDPLLSSTAHNNVVKYLCGKVNELKDSRKFDIDNHTVFFNFESMEYQKSITACINICSLPGGNIFYKICVDVSKPAGFPGVPAYSSKSISAEDFTEVKDSKGNILKVNNWNSIVNWFK